MKRQGKRIVSIVLLAFLTFGMFSGCGSTGDKKTEASADAKSAPVDLRVEVFDRGVTGQLPPDNNYWTKWIQENFKRETNINVIFVPIPRSQEVDKLNVLMASAEAPDICITYNGGTVYNYIKQNGLADLSQYVSNSPNIQKFIGKDVLKYGIFSGKQYAIPARRANDVNASIGTFIRKDWLDKLGMPVPKTTDEFYNTMKAFKDKNPGNVAGVIPFGLSSNVGYYASQLIESFKKEMTEEEFATLPDCIKPGYKDAIRFLNKMYNEGLITSDFALDKDQANYNANITKGKVGCFSANYAYPYSPSGSLASALKQMDPNATIIPCDPFTNYEGKHKKIADDPLGILSIVPAFSKRAAEAVKYLDWLSRSDVMYFLQNGEENYHYTLKDGIPIQNKIEGEKKFNTGANLDYTLSVNGIYLGSLDKNIKAQSAAYPGYEKEYLECYKNAITDYYLAFHFDKPIESETKLGKVLGEKSTELMIKSIIAKPSEFDKVYDDLSDQYMKLGGTEVMNEKKEAYKAMKSGK